MVMTDSRVLVNRVTLPIRNPAHGQLSRDNVVSLSLFAPENFVSQDRIGRPIPRHPHTQAVWYVQMRSIFSSNTCCRVAFVEQSGECRALPHQSEGFDMLRFCLNTGEEKVERS